jgi:hypothetical protein
VPADQGACDRIAMHAVTIAGEIAMMQRLEQLFNDEISRH